MRLTLIFPALLLAAAGASAQPSAPLMAHDGMPMLHGATEPVAPGVYRVEPGHTQVTFAVTHLGISPYAGWFSGASGMLSLDPAHPEAAKLTVSIPIASVMTTSDKLTSELKSADWFDAATYPTATFTSTSVRPMGPQAAVILGTLTLHGVTKPAEIRARLFGSATNAMSKAPSVGFVGRMVINRSDFGVTKYVPMVSDQVDLVINAAFERDATPGPSHR